MSQESKKLMASGASIKQKASIKTSQPLARKVIFKSRLKITK